MIHYANGRVTICLFLCVASHRCWAPPPPSWALAPAAHLTEPGATLQSSGRRTGSSELMCHTELVLPPALLLLGFSAWEQPLPRGSHTNQQPGHPLESIPRAWLTFSPMGPARSELSREVLIFRGLPRLKNFQGKEPQRPGLHCQIISYCTDILHSLIPSWTFGPCPPFTTINIYVLAFV